MKSSLITKNIAYILTGICTIAQISCKKSWLDAKPDKSLVIPTTIKDFQAILDNNTASQVFNLTQASLSEIGAGDFTLTYDNWQGLQNAQERNAYIWATDVFAGETSYDWDNAYKRILYANVVLDGVSKVTIDPQSQADWNNIKGTALYFRAYDLFNLVQEFGKAYDPATASSDLGIPLRLTSDVNIKSQRSTIQQSYDQIIKDLLTAKALLPTLPLYQTRAGKCSVYGLLSRIYLNSSQYDKAFSYADSCLQLNKNLLDFNSLDPSAANPIARFNPEVIYHHSLLNYSALDNNAPVLVTDPSFFNSYNTNDLRKQIFFKTASGVITRNASYSGENLPFGGLATDEMYLIRAECFARQNNVQAAMQDLNTLLIKRWKTGTYVAYTATDSDDALAKILAERRKELVYRGLRWYDLKRLNKDARFAVTLTRMFNGKQYSLAPNDPKYVYPIPPDEILLSGLQQNPR